tara:strand:+ start:349 stop:546 length:198 start_codon:yes stop_codon:yes gene_type:complete
MRIEKINEIIPINRLPFYHFFQEDEEAKSKKSTSPLLLEGDPVCYNKLGRIVKFKKIKENYDERY